MLSPKRRAAAALVLTFALGMAVGVAAHKMFGGRPKPPLPAGASRHITGVLEKRLDLTAEQKQRVHAIILRFAQENDTLFRNARTQLRERMALADREIEALLTEDQKAEFQTFVRERDRRRPPF